MDTCTQPKALATSPLRNGNPQGDPNSAPRCGAKTRAGTPCQCPAMKNRRRCRMHGGKCRGPTTPEGRARISAARDQGKGYSKKYKAQNDAVASIVRRTRVFTAMSAANMELAEVAPLMRDLCGALGKTDPGDAAASPASASSYARDAMLALADDRLAMRALTHAIREAGRRRRAEHRLARSKPRKTRKDAMYREDARAGAAHDRIRTNASAWRPRGRRGLVPGPLTAAGHGIESNARAGGGARDTPAHDGCKASATPTKPVPPSRPTSPWFGGQDHGTETRPSRPGSAKTRENAMHRESARTEAQMPQTIPATEHHTVRPGSPTSPMRENAEKTPCTVGTLPPPAMLNRKQRRWLAKFAKASHAPRAATQHMTRPARSAKRPS